MAETATTRMEQVAAEDEAIRQRDRDFHRQWLQDQKETYPQFANSYQRQLDRMDEEDKAASDAPAARAAIKPVFFSNGSAIAGAEPGHDPTIQQLNEDTADERDDSRQGMDNRPPHEVVRDTAISQPSGTDGEVSTADDGKKSKGKAATTEESK